MDKEVNMTEFLRFVWNTTRSDGSHTEDYCDLWFEEKDGKFYICTEEETIEVKTPLEFAETIKKLSTNILQEKNITRIHIIED